MEQHQASFRFYGELNDFLRPDRRQVTVPYAFNGRPGIKDPIEVLGVPHTEVDLIVANGRSVGFDYQLRDGDRVAVYPVFASLDISPIMKLREKPLGPAVFILDVHLGKLARLLRLLGFDAKYRNDYDDDEIIRIALAEHRIILTRDRLLLCHRIVTHGHCLHSTEPVRQARAVLARFALAGQVRYFYRCPACNGIVRPVAKDAVQDLLEPLTRKYYTEFTQCAACGQVYWRGSHYERIVSSLDRITGADDLPDC